MILAAIVAMAENNAIGVDNDLPWRLPDDLKFFKRVTSGKPVLMGRKTFESLGRPLVNRLNIVITTREHPELPEGVLHYNNIDDAIARMKEEGKEEGFIIGGGKIYEQTLPMLDRLYITRVHTTIADAHTYFPELNAADWKLTWEENHEKDERHAYDFTFQQLDKIK